MCDLMAAKNSAREESKLGVRRTRAGLRRSRISALLLSTVSTFAVVSGAMAQDDVSSQTKNLDPTENLVVTGLNQNSSAVAQAPTKAPLTAIQPTSVIDRNYIDHNVPLSGSFVDIVKLAPSVMSIDQNGPGLGEGHVSIRGFQDGQYNVLLDGIPFQDVNNFTHHTTSYFMPHDLENVEVDRGPGSASTLGVATFGGTISMQTKDPSKTMTVTPYASGGSWNTWTAGAQYDSGKIKATHGAQVMLDFEHGESDGAVSYAGQQRTNIFGKVLIPLAPHTVLTAVAMGNFVRQFSDHGASRAQIAKYGPDYGLNDNPHSQSFYRYNKDPVHTDFEYLGLRSDLGANWTLDDKIYTYGYYHQSILGTDLSGNTKNGTIYDPNGVPGQPSKSDYRAFGNTLRIKKDFSFGDVGFGVWVEHQSASRNGFEADLSHGNAPTPNSIKAIDDMMHLGLTTIQPYVEVDWHITPRLTFTPGLKYDFFGRDIAAPVNQTTKTPLYYSKDYGAAVPNFSLHYMISKKWSAYAQAAEGFLAPQSNYFYVADPSRNTLSPQKTWNYQLGTSYQTSRYSLSGDVYYIDFGNLVASRTVGNYTSYYNQGGVNYYGVEAEATISMGRGVSIFANGSFNQAKTKGTNKWIASAPDATAAGGIVYNRGKVYASLMDKWVGSQFGDTNETQGIDPFNQLDMSLGYNFYRFRPDLKPMSVKLQLNNLADSRAITALAGYSGGSKTPLYYVLPGRSVFVTVEAPF